MRTRRIGPPSPPSPGRELSKPIGLLHSDPGRDIRTGDKGGLIAVTLFCAAFVIIWMAWVTSVIVHVVGVH